MRIVIQRVNSAQVLVSQTPVGKIQQGLLLYVGVEQGDDDAMIERIVSKITRLRMFTDTHGKMNQSVLDVRGEVLIVSQFTLCADLSRGNRPSFDSACEPTIAQAIYDRLCERFSQILHTETGVFGASMEVLSSNAGPVTFLYESKNNSKTI